MKNQGKVSAGVGYLLAFLAHQIALADEVKILAADFQKDRGQRWTVNVTLAHADTGWDHYADAWRILDAKDNVLAERVLHHPHVREQPFTRGLDHVELPEGTTIVYIEAHDTVHGWSPQRLSVDLGAASDGRVRVDAR